MARFTTSDGLSLHFTDEGDGPALLCLAGLTRNGTDFDYAMPALAGCRIIRPDYRGRGQSDWAEDFSTYNVLREAQDVLELMDHLGIESAGFLGTSRGGLISLTLAAMARTRILGVCFVDIGPVIETGGLEVILGFLGRNPVWKTHAEAAEVFGSRMIGFDNVPESRWRQEVEKHFVETGQGLTINYDPKLRDATLATFDPNAEAPDLWPLYEALAGVPVAAIRGANSDLFSAQTLAEMGARRPDLIAATVPDRGHVPFLDEVEAVDALQLWISKMDRTT
ncbi:Pimeloyl-ACP methyl ester carboxylesterase [Shimia gijangensis]|uniref:Pimeloyl-ACP methyl ester carboxylesterase n=1 Tax=Shimia gijangensis TaxID=1470563 RepID=A0A1M6II81_9RHOB|nr:alpha/beta hydrolase [Shimia gijangensis]SHJ34116.1 Pimeloyl-ACP methyl ester carboxylesterase [Shimia gijangensis]